MTLRDLAFVLTLALALPAVVLIVRDAVAADDRTARPVARALHVLWTAVPVVLLAALIVLAVSE